MKRDTIIVVYGWRFKQVVFAFYAKPSPTPPSLIIIRSIVKHRQHVCEGGGGLIWVLLIAAPHRAPGSHPEQELSHASLGGVRAGQGRNADNTTLGTMVTRTRSMQGTHCMQTLQVCCSYHSPSVAPVAGCRADNIYTCVCARIFRTRQQHTSCKQCSAMLNLGSGHLFVVCLRCGLFSNISSA